MTKDFFDLSGKIVIITGGAGLIGKAYVEACAQYGAIVIFVDINDTAANKVVADVKKKTHNQNVFHQKCSIVNKGEIKKLIDVVLKRHGKIDALVNNAYPKSKNYGKKYEDVSYEDFCENLNLHLGGYYLMTHELSLVMMKQKSGVIVNMGSHYGFAAPRFEIYEGTDMTMPVEYSAIKGGIINLTRYLAAYLGKYNIRVNAISPGGVFNNQPKSFVKKYEQKVLLGKRMASVDDLAGVLVFLLSDASKYMTGQNIVVDGGLTI